MEARGLKSQQMSITSQMPRSRDPNKKEERVALRVRWKFLTQMCPRDPEQHVSLITAVGKLSISVLLALLLLSYREQLLSRQEASGHHTLSKAGPLLPLWNCSSGQAVAASAGRVPSHIHRSFSLETTTSLFPIPQGGPFTL